MAGPIVQSTHLSASHSFSKSYTSSITLIAGQGVYGDCHAGQTVQHIEHAQQQPSAPNLRQVHLIPYELCLQLAPYGFAIQPGELGENITTFGIDLLSLPRGSYLYLGDGADCAVVQVTGLRNPGPRLEQHKPGLLEKLKWKDQNGSEVMNCGIMAVVSRGGIVKEGATIRVTYPEEQCQLGPV